jgi:hypothetical protein
MLSISPDNRDATDGRHHRGEDSMKSLFRRKVMYPDRRDRKHYRSQDAVDETQGRGNYTELIGAKGCGLTFIAHRNDYARTSLRKGSIEYPMKDFGGSRSPVQGRGLSRDLFR